MDVYLVAVQAAVRPDAYRSAEAFREWVLELTACAVAERPKLPTLVAFPEVFGMPLLVLLGENHVPTRLSSLARLLLRRHWRALAGGALRGRGLRSFYSSRALEVYRAYHDAFAEAARTYGVTIVAGSVFLPHVEQEASRGLHVADAHVSNVAYTFGPSGTVLDRTRKRYLTSGIESRVGLTADDAAQHSFETPVGRVGVAICLDGFYSGVMERFDGLGVQIVVQPSANFAAWSRPWPADPTLTEGEAWLRYGLRQQLQNRYALRYGVNPMLVGELFGMRIEGCSSLSVNTRYAAANDSHEDPTEDAPDYPGLLALARRPDREAIVARRVTL
ncbi:MAG: nitrilase-related carbon-nitrogen hydrolase [Trueperaceae bacterium]|nr:nitrilase-related carbon-nitrogen hydrolase [Trueperaceae bacterium]